MAEPMEKQALPAAFVMNMFYTGLGIARSLGEHGISVIGLSAQRGVYGNYTRYAKTLACPDSRREPEALLARLLELGRKFQTRSVIFPTRDDDVIFLDRFRKDLEPYFILTVPSSPVIQASLDKWETFLRAGQADVPTPKCWLVESENDLHRAAAEATYPCVMKPVAAYHWRKGGNWELVGARKAIGISTAAELRAEYKIIARANPRALLQELVPGNDECLVIAACYMDRQSRFVAGFNTQKLVQTPAGFGTGCILQAADRPELFERSVRLLQQMQFTGIAEVEYKWDARKNDYQLIEINPRPWDQHRLGKSCGVDLVYLAYCEAAGLAFSPLRPRPSTCKWVAEDAFLLAAMQSLWRRDSGLSRLFRFARGKRIYAVWSWRDPLPSLVFMPFSFFPALLASGARSVWSRLRGRFAEKPSPTVEGLVHERFENENSHS